MYERYTTDDSYIVDANDPVKGFFASAKAGTLPSVSFIDPNFIDEPDGQDNDDGAPSDIAAGQRLIGEIVQAVMQCPKWNKTLLLITYDEHGGFYDHVNPLIHGSGIKQRPCQVSTTTVCVYLRSSSPRGLIKGHAFAHIRWIGAHEASSDGLCDRCVIEHHITHR